MYTPRPFEVVFLTNFSDTCFRAIPTLAQMADDLETRLTLLHSYDVNASSHSKAQAKLRSFFPEADYYARSRRIAMPGKPVDVMRQFRAENPVDLIVVPSSDPLGMPRLGHQSLRAQLLLETGAPLWTIGRKTPLDRLNTRVRNVACWIDLKNPDITHVKLAFEYAWKLDAKLHLLHAIPEIHEGSVLLPLFYDLPLNAEGATAKIRDMIGWLPITPEVHVMTGSTRRAMVELTRRCEADILFVGKGQAIQKNWSRRLKINTAIDHCACPVVCVDGDTANMPAWSLDRGPAFQTRTSVYQTQLEKTA